MADILAQLYPRFKMLTIHDLAAFLLLLVKYIWKLLKKLLELLPYSTFFTCETDFSAMNHTAPNSRARYEIGLVCCTNTREGFVGKTFY